MKKNKMVKNKKQIDENIIEKNLCYLMQEVKKDLKVKLQIQEKMLEVDQFQNSCCLPFSELINDKTFKNLDELKNIF